MYSSSVVLFWLLLIVPVFSDYLVVVQNTTNGLALISETTGELVIIADIPPSNQNTTDEFPSLFGAYHQQSSTYYVLVPNNILFSYNTATKKSNSITLPQPGFLTPLCISQSGELYGLVTMSSTYGKSISMYYATINTTTGTLQQVSADPSLDPNNTGISYSDTVQCMVDDANHQIITSASQSVFGFISPLLFTTQLQSDFQGATHAVDANNTFGLFTTYTDPFKSGNYYVYMFTPGAFGSILYSFTSTKPFELHLMGWYPGLTTYYATINENAKALCAIQNLESVEIIDLVGVLHPKKSLPIKLPTPFMYASSQASTFVWFP